jgi:hypothetical protein
MSTKVSKCSSRIHILAKIIPTKLSNQKNENTFERWRKVRIFGVLIRNTQKIFVHQRNDNVDDVLTYQNRKKMFCDSLRIKYSDEKNMYLGSFVN